MGREFLLRRTDPEGEWFDLKFGDYARVLVPRTMAYELREGPGEHCIAVDGVLVEFNQEDPGIQVTFHGEIGEARAKAIVSEVLENLMGFARQQGRIVEL